MPTDPNRAKSIFLNAADRYAERAVDLLRQAFAKGFKDVAKFKKDPAFHSIRAREAFQKLLAELEAKTKK